MPARVPIGEVVERVSLISDLAQAFGLELDKPALRDDAVAKLGYRGPMKVFFSPSHAERHPTHTAPSAVLKRVDSVCGRVVGAALPVVRKSLKLNGKKPAPKDLPRLARKLSPEDRSQVAASLTRAKLKRYFREPQMSVTEFHRLLRKFCKGQTIARKRLITHLQQEFERRGIRMSFDTIEERFRPNTKVKTIPACVKQIVAEMDGSFLTGLIPIEEMTGDVPPDQWLRQKREQYGFRSDSAMHKAIAQATGLKYDSVHKALSGPRKARKIQHRLKECFEHWNERQKKGDPLDVCKDYLGVPIDSVRELMDRLAPLYPTKQRMYAAVAEALQINPSSAKRYHSNHIKIRYVAAEKCERLQSLLKEREALGPVKADRRVTKSKETVEVLSRRAERALNSWQHDMENLRLKLTFKALRLKLIVRLKDRHERQTAAL